MSRIKGNDTLIEVKARKYLYRNGFRYRKNVSKLPGKPDIVLAKYKTVIFVHGCFWHRHEGCKDTSTPKTRVDFWEKKFKHNVENDKKHQAELREAGWHVIILWECDINHRFEETMAAVLSELKHHQ